MNQPQQVKLTALHGKHVELGARMGQFAGFDMPMWYEGIKAEHLAVRESAGVFDLSHMGEFFIKGRQAFDLIQYLTCNDLRRIGDGQCQYTLFPTPEGGVVDDLIAYQINPEEYMLVVNASNIEKDLKWVLDHNRFDCEVTDRSADFSLIAVQGPKTDELLKSVGFAKIASQEAFTFKRTKLQGHRIIVAGTGYTGERGFELIVPNESAEWLWDKVMDAGSELGAVPVGLGARDTLRLEMAYSLYGHELSDEISVLEADLGWTVRFGPEFIGREFLLKQSETGVDRIIAGIIVEKKYGAPRNGVPVKSGRGDTAGIVTSGSFSPSLDCGIALVLINPELAEPGTQLQVEIRNKLCPAEVTSLPFYKRS